MVSTERTRVAREFTQVRYPHTHTTNTSDFLSVQCAEVDTSATHILLASTPTEVMCYISSKESPPMLKAIFGLIHTPHFLRAVATCFWQGLKHKLNQNLATI